MKILINNHNLEKLIDFFLIYFYFKYYKENTIYNTS